MDTVLAFTVIGFVRVSAQFGTCTVVTVIGTLVEDKMLRFKDECAHFRFSKCSIYTHEGASTKFSTKSNGADETDNSVFGLEWRAGLYGFYAERG
jgi:hypothetical protein